MNYPEDYIIDGYRAIEKLKVSKSLVKTIKDTLFHNPYEINTNNNLMWKEQCGINLPLLYYASLVLYRWGTQNNCDNYLFATRDCTHWYKIFKNMFPHVNCKYFHCSRNSLTRATIEDNIYYDEYVSDCLKNSSPTKTVFVDIHGTCVRILRYFKKTYNILPYTMLLSSSYEKYADFPQISMDHQKTGKLLTLVFDVRGTPIETLNYDIIGTLQGYDQNGPVRDQLEYSMHYLEAYHVCINYAVDQLKPVDLTQLNSINFSILCKIVQVYFKALIENKPIICVYIKQPCKH
jgi:hypothetical protein